MVVVDVVITAGVAVIGVYVVVVVFVVLLLVVPEWFYQKMVCSIPRSSPSIPPSPHLLVLYVESWFSFNRRNVGFFSWFVLTAHRHSYDRPRNWRYTVLKHIFD